MHPSYNVSETSNGRRETQLCKLVLEKHLENERFFWLENWAEDVQKVISKATVWENQIRLGNWCETTQLDIQGTWFDSR